MITKKTKLPKHLSKGRVMALRSGGTCRIMCRETLRLGQQVCNAAEAGGARHALTTMMNPEDFEVLDEHAPECAHMFVVAHDWSP